MADGVGRDAPSGSITVRRGVIAVPQTAVAGSGTATATATFLGAKANNSVVVNPRALLQGAGGIWGALCLADDVITILFGTGGAALTITAQTMDCQVGQW